MSDLFLVSALRLALMRRCLFFFFFFNDPATPEFYPLSLPDALPISASTLVLRTTMASSPRTSPPAKIATSASVSASPVTVPGSSRVANVPRHPGRLRAASRSEEHTSELQSRLHLVCRLLLEKKKSSC